MNLLIVLILSSVPMAAAQASPTGMLPLVASHFGNPGEVRFSGVVTIKDSAGMPAFICGKAAGDDVHDQPTGDRRFMVSLNQRSVDIDWPADPLLALVTDDTASCRAATAAAAKSGNKAAAASICYAGRARMQERQSTARFQAFWLARCDLSRRMAAP